MGIVEKLFPVGTAADRTDLQFHHLNITTADGGRAVVSYITGAVVDEPRVVASTSKVTIPEDTVLIEHDSDQQYTEINSHEYPIHEYTASSTADVAPAFDTHSLPEELRGTTVEKQELSTTDFESLAEKLP